MVTKDEVVLKNEEKVNNVLIRFPMVKILYDNPVSFSTENGRSRIAWQCTLHPVDLNDPTARTVNNESFYVARLSNFVDRASANGFCCPVGKAERERALRIVPKNIKSLREVISVLQNMGDLTEEKKVNSAKKLRDVATEIESSEIGPIETEESKLRARGIKFNAFCRLLARKASLYESDYVLTDHQDVSTVTDETFTNPIRVTCRKHEGNTEEVSFSSIYEAGSHVCSKCAVENLDLIESLGGKPRKFKAVPPTPNSWKRGASRMWEDTCAFLGIRLENIGRSLLLAYHHIEGKEDFPELGGDYYFNSLPMFYSIHLYYHNVYMKGETSLFYDIDHVYPDVRQTNLVTCLTFLIQLDRDFDIQAPNRMLDIVNKGISDYWANEIKNNRELNPQAPMIDRSAVRETINFLRGTGYVNLLIETTRGRKYVEALDSEIQKFVFGPDFTIPSPSSSSDS